MATLKDERDLQRQLVSLIQLGLGQCDILTGIDGLQRSAGYPQGIEDRRSHVDGEFTTALTAGKTLRYSTRTGFSVGMGNAAYSEDFALLPVAELIEIAGPTGMQAIHAQMKAYDPGSTITELEDASTDAAAWLAGL